MPSFPLVVRLDFFFWLLRLASEAVSAYILVLELQTKVCEDYANIPGAHLEVEDAGLVVAAGQVLQHDVLGAGQTRLPVTWRQYLHIQHCIYANLLQNMFAMKPMRETPIRIRLHGEGQI